MKTIFAIITAIILFIIGASLGSTTNKVNENIAFIILIIDIILLSILVVVALKEKENIAREGR